MKKLFTFDQLVYPLMIIGIAAALRIIPHPANVAPIAAMALFGGIYLDKKYALVIPLVAMFLSDIILGFHASMPLVYASFLLAGFIGLWVRNHKNPQMIFLASLTSSLLFFILTNFNYWYSNSLYPKTLEGLFMSYYFALPFFKNTIIGDVFYTALLCGGYELILKFTILKKWGPQN